MLASKFDSNNGKVIMNDHYYPINENFLTGQAKQGVRHKTKRKKLTSKSNHSRETSLQEQMSKGILCH